MIKYCITALMMYCAIGSTCEKCLEKISIQKDIVLNNLNDAHEFDVEYLHYLWGQYYAFMECEDIITENH
jgi:hypothetical protein